MEGAKSTKESIESLRKEWITTKKTDLEILLSLRLGTADYDFEGVKDAKKFGQGFIFDIKSKVDGNTYVGKRLQFQIGSLFIDPLLQTQAEREMTLLRLQNHPMICKVVDAVKDGSGFPYIIMEKCNRTL
jgi:serine/threonine protein kinase